MTRRLLASAPEVHFSYARQSEGVDARPSRLDREDRRSAARICRHELAAPAIPRRSPSRLKMPAASLPSRHAAGGPACLPRNRSAPSKPSLPRASARRIGMRPKRDSLHRSAACCSRGAAFDLGRSARGHSHARGIARIAGSRRLCRAAMCAAFSRRKCRRVRANRCRNVLGTRRDAAHRSGHRVVPLRICARALHRRLKQSRKRRVDCRAIASSCASTESIASTTARCSSSITKPATSRRSRWDLPRPDDVQLPLYAGFALDRRRSNSAASCSLRFAPAKHANLPAACAMQKHSDARSKGNKGLVRNTLKDERHAAWRTYIEQMAQRFLAGRAEVEPARLSQDLRALRPAGALPHPGQKKNKQATIPTVRRLPMLELEKHLSLRITPQRERALDRVPLDPRARARRLGQDDSARATAFCACSPKWTIPARSSPSPSPRPQRPRCATAFSTSCRKHDPSSSRPRARLQRSQGSAGISSIFPRNCASPPSTPFAAISRCSSRSSPASAAASTSPRSQPTLPPRRAPNPRAARHARRRAQRRHRIAPPLARQQLAGNRRPARRHARRPRPLDARLRPRPRSGLAGPARASRAPASRAPIPPIPRSPVTPTRSGRSSAPASRCCATPPPNCASSLPKLPPRTSSRSRRSRSTCSGRRRLPTDAALAVADGIRHLLVDEFQDTSRRQHQLLAHLVAAWPEREAAPASSSATPCSPSTSSATPTPSSFRASSNSASKFPATSRCASIPCSSPPTSAPRRRSI